MTSTLKNSYKYKNSPSNKDVLQLASWSNIWNDIKNSLGSLTWEMYLSTRRTNSQTEKDYDEQEEMKITKTLYFYNSDVSKVDLSSCINFTLTDSYDGKDGKEGFYYYYVIKFNNNINSFNINIKTLISDNKL